jgi:TetR/AcrR family transcriptional repressor of nem operon
MRVSQAEKEKSRSRIIESAARLLRERGVDGASVADVMSDAGLTHGGFYRHFDTKDSLIRAALDSAFDQIVARLNTTDRPSGSETLSGDLATFEALYLSDAHVAAPGRGCPVAALAGDVGRTGDTVRETFAQGVRRIVSGMANQLSGSRAQRRARAYRQLAMMAGAVVIARASDAETAAEVLAACRQAHA